MQATWRRAAYTEAIQDDRCALNLMGAYLSQPVTEKETFVGAKAGFLEYGGCSMQV